MGKKEEINWFDEVGLMFGNKVISGEIGSGKTELLHAMVSKSAREDTLNLSMLIGQNLDLEVIPMVRSGVVDDGRGYWMGKLEKASVREYCTFNERMYLKELDYDEVMEKMMGLAVNPDLSSSEVEVKAEKLFEELDWKKAIIVWVNN